MESASSKKFADGSVKNFSGELGIGGRLRSNGSSGRKDLLGSTSSHRRSRSCGEERPTFEYFGWVYHLGTNSIGHDYCHHRFLFIRGKYVEMYKRNPHENHGINPLRRGIIGPTLMVEELGRREVNHGEVYVIRFYSRLDETKKGEIACATAGEVQKWMEAFGHAKQQAEYELSKAGNSRNKLSVEADIDLEAHRPKVRRYARGLKKLIKIGQGPESLSRQPSNLGSDRGDAYFDSDNGDAIDSHEWKCVRTINGVRIFEDAASSKSGKGALVKAVGVIDASADVVFQVILSLDKHQRYEWDALTGDLERVDCYDGHYDVVYCTYDPKYLTRWRSKKDFVFSRQWVRGQDGMYTILQFPAAHKKRPTRSGYQRTKITPSTWEIRSLDLPMSSDSQRCLVTHMLETHSTRWYKWKKNSYSKFEKTIPFALLIQVAGLKEYIGANPSFKYETASMVMQSKFSELSPSCEYDDGDMEDEFYDATDSSSSDDESDDDEEQDQKEINVKLKNVSSAIASLATKRDSAPDANHALEASAAPFRIDPSQFHGSLRQGKDDNDSDCWSSPSGMGFMIRGKTYLKDNSKVMGGEPLLNLIAVDWFKVDKAEDKIALHPNCLVQSEAGKAMPFILVINLQVPAKPNYCLVLYYAADRPINKSSLLGKFADGSDAFRDARFKLIPSIVQGYWMVKRAVGTRACLLGKAVTCKYLRQDNFLEIDVDIGSSSVARSVISLVLGYVTSLIVDLAILIEAKEESELPEYILGTVRLNRIKPESAIPLEE